MRTPVRLDDPDRATRSQLRRGNTPEPGILHLKFIYARFLLLGTYLRGVWGWRVGLVRSYDPEIAVLSGARQEVTVNIPLPQLKQGDVDKPQNRMVHRLQGLVSAL